MFANLFPDLTDENWEDKCRHENDYPYVINLVNVSYSTDECLYCEERYCQNCPLPFSERLKVIDMINKLGDNCKNNYYFHDPMANTETKREFELEIVFNANPDKAIIKFDELNSLPKEESSINVPKRSIYECMEFFNEWETLDAANLWYCSTCKENVCAKKKIEITDINQQKK